MTLVGANDGCRSHIKPTGVFRPMKRHHVSRMHKPPALPIRTDRFHLRDYSPADEPEFIRYQTDPGFAIHHTADERGAQHARAVFRKFIDWQAETPRTNYQLAVCHAAEDDRLIGSCGIRMETPGAETADFGIELARRYWGRHRFAIEISEAIIDWAFTCFPLKALTADTAPGNVVAARLAQSAGFTPVGVSEKRFWRLDKADWAPGARARSQGEA